MLDRSRRYAAEAGASVEWVQDDMREFVRPGSFDLAVCLFTPFGYVDDPAENEAVLANALRSLKPGGSFVLDVTGKGGRAKLVGKLLPRAARQAGLGWGWRQPRRVLRTRLVASTCRQGFEAAPPAPRRRGSASAHWRAWTRPLSRGRGRGVVPRRVSPRGSSGDGQDGALRLPPEEEARAGEGRLRLQEVGHLEGLEPSFAPGRCTPRQRPRIVSP